MSIGAVVKRIVKKGKNAEFESAFKANQAGVRADEPGNIYYDLYKSPDDAQVYYIVERYKAESDFEVHRQSAHVAVWREIAPSLVEGAPELHMLKLVSPLHG